MYNGDFICLISNNQISSIYDETNYANAAFGCMNWSPELEFWNCWTNFRCLDWLWN